MIWKVNSGKVRIFLGLFASFLKLFGNILLLEIMEKPPRLCFFGAWAASAETRSWVFGLAVCLRRSWCEVYVLATFAIISLAVALPARFGLLEPPPSGFSMTAINSSSSSPEPMSISEELL